MSYTAAIIGCGNIANLYSKDSLITGIYTHAGAYFACANTKLIAVCDINLNKAMECAEYWGNKNNNKISAYSDLEQFLRECNPDIVSICTPDNTHTEILIKVIQNSSIKAVLLEKPVGLTFDSAKVAIDLAQKNNIIIAVNYSRRYSKGHQEIKTILDNNSIGVIQSVLGYYTKGIIHNGTHWLDLARWLVGDISSSQGTLTNNNSKIDAILQFKNGASGYLKELDKDKFSLFEMDIVGTQGRISILESGHTKELYVVENSKQYSGYKTLVKTKVQDNCMQDTLFYAVEDLVKCLKLGKKPICSGLDGLIALQIAENIINTATQTAKDPELVKEINV